MCCVVSLGLARAQEKIDTIYNYKYNYKFSYLVGNDLLTSGLSNNNYEFSELLSQLNYEHQGSLDTIMFRGMASPEGTEDRNFELAFNRSHKFRELVFSRRPNIYSIPTYLDATVATWTDVTDFIAKDYSFPNKNETLAIFRHTNPQNALKVIKSIFPDSYKHLLNVTLPYFRSVDVSVICSEGPAKQYWANKELYPPVTSDDEANNEISTYNMIAPQTTIQPMLNPNGVEPAPEAVEAVETVDNAKPLAPLYTLTSKPLFALKTNLLYDAITALNFELEIPLAKRWSIALEGVFPWWLGHDKQYALQLINVNLELRHWFGNRTNRPAMTGWFMGAYGGVGYYDIELADKGFQGEFWMAGVSAGFAHTINKRGTLRLEYSVGIGYMRTNYREYVPRFGTDNEWHLIRRETGRVNFAGPNKAKISLVWMLNYNKKNRVY